MRIKNTIFANYDYNETWSAIGTCSHCEGPATDSSGRTYFFKDLYFVNTTQRVKFDTPFKEIIYDEDGTLTESATHRWVVFDFQHLHVSECSSTYQPNYDGLLCSDQIKIRRVLFYEPKPFDSLKGLPMKVLNLGQVPQSRVRRNMQDSACPTDTATLSTIDSTSVDALTNQQSLLNYYEPFYLEYDNWTTVRDARSDCSCASECTVDSTLASFDYCDTSASETVAANSADTCTCNINCGTYLCTEQTYNSSLSTLLGYVDQRDLDYGYFDTLWNTSSTFCDSGNYADISYRFKANPKKNWVIPLVTGYEYKLSIGQGADFEQMNVEYSYQELLQNETDGVILHFNHTERSESFNVTYTNSSDSSEVKVGAHVGNSTFTTKLNFTNSVMGDMYVNNVTRDFAMKFDGQNNDMLKFVLERDECITEGGCNGGNVITDAQCEETERNWSDASSWATTGRVPVDGEDAVIENGWNMVLDISETPILRSLEING